MINKLSTVSMNGRMAYVIMCVETYFLKKYPERDWALIFRIMWKATSMNWADWADMYSSVIPDVILQFDAYSSKEFSNTLSVEEFAKVKNLYFGITEGIEDDPNDEVNYMLNKPFEMAMVYEGTVIDDGKESFEIIEKTEQILRCNGFDLPDYSKVLFSSVNEHNGWGNDFDGVFLSCLLNKQLFYKSNILLRKHKGGGLCVLRLCDSFDLFRDGRQTAAVILV